MKNILSLLLCFVSVQMLAQKIYLNSGEIITQPNVESITQFQNWKDAQFENYNYCIVQFSKSTSLKEREQISKQTGILFFDYMPQWAFIAAIPVQTNIPSLSNYHIQTVLPYTSKYKLDKQLQERPLPYWVQKENNEVEILLYTYPNIDKTTIESCITKNHFRLIDWQDETTVKVIMNEANLEQATQNQWIKYIIATDAPGQLENTEGRSDHRVNLIDAATATGYHFDGTGVSVAIGDDGAIGPHIDFKGRLYHHPANMGMGGTHCDHVAGIVGGAGNFNPKGKGNGKGADLHIYEDYGNLTNAPNHYDNYGVRITSNSLGQGCNDGYNNSAKNADNLINSKPSLMSVHSAGNSGATQCGGVAQGYYTITGGYKVGKNVIAVGNVEKDDKIASSSSRGPSKDGRIKPEICAVGTDVFSTQPNNTYDNFTGTSMACPGVAGTLADLWQAYRSFNAGADPNSAMMKAVLLNTADDLGNAGPDFIYGFGRINAYRSLNVIKNNQYFIDSVDNGDTKTINLNVPNGVKQLKVMLYWHDPAGNPQNAIALVNDLDFLLVSPNATTYKPWVLNNAANVPALSALATRQKDSLNNVEQITLDTVAVGSYQLKVVGYNIPQGPQTFVVTYEYIMDEVKMTYPNGGEGFVNGVKERVRWDASSSAASFKLEYSSDAGANWVVIADPIAGDRRYYDWTPPNNITSGKMLTRISQNLISDMSDTTFSLIKVPTGLTIDTACGNVIHLKWDSLPEANKYKVYQLGAKYMEPIGTASTNEYYIYNGVNMADTIYFAVAAMDSISGADGRRCIAYRKLPGEINCLDDLINLGTSLPFEKLYACQSSGNVPITMKIQNIGLRAVTNLPVTYQVNNLNPVTETIPTTLNIGDTITYTFATTVNMLNAGTYVVRTWTASNADINQLNDTTSATAIVVAPLPVTAPYTQTFDTTIFTPNGWKVYDYDNGVKWQKTFCQVGANGTNTYAAYMDFFNYNSKNAIDDIETPLLDLTGVTADSVLLTFDLAHAYGANIPDTLSLWVSLNCIDQYVPLNYKKWGQDLATAGMMNVAFTPTAINQWRKDQVDLSSFKGQKIFVRFRGSNNKGNNLFIDNVNLITKNVTPLSVNDLFGTQSITVHPNPSNGKFTLSIESLEANDLDISILNVTGQVIMKDQLKVAKGKNTKEFDITKYANGFYIIEISNGTQTQKLKLTKW